MELVRLACHAMATRFELALAGGPEARLRAAAECAIANIHRLESLLSAFRGSSDIGRINAQAGQRPVRVDGEVFGLLQHARELHALTGGAFDVTVGPLMHSWGLRGGGVGRTPDEDELRAVRGRVGMEHVELEEQRGTVRFARPGMALDLGGIAKGYALEEAARLLREAGVENALLHGGTSSVVALGTAPTGGDWKVVVEYPRTGDDVPPPLAVIPLRDRALSVSAGWGRQVRDGDATYGHVLDPRSGKPTEAALLAVAACDSATDADAISTALLVLGDLDIPRVDTLVLARGDADPYRVLARGISPRPWPDALQSSKRPPAAVPV